MRVLLGVWMRSRKLNADDVDGVVVQMGAGKDSDDAPPEVGAVISEAEVAAAMISVGDVAGSPHVMVTYSGAVSSSAMTDFINCSTNECSA